MMVLYIPDQSKYRTEPFSYCVFDRSWTKLRSGILQLPFADFDVFYELPLLTKDAAIWMPFWTKTGKKGDVTHEIWVWRAGRKDVEKIPLTNESGTLIYSMQLAQSRNDDFCRAWSSLPLAQSHTAALVSFDQAHTTRDANIFTINFLQRLTTHESCAWSKDTSAAVEHRA